MNAEAMIFMDTENSGRYFDVRTCNVKAFHTIEELLSLCRSAQHAGEHARNEALFPHYPAKGKLASLHIYVFAVDLNGAHGTLHVSLSEYVMFRSDHELERLISKESLRALKRLQKKANGRCCITFQDNLRAQPHDIVNALKTDAADG